MCTKENKYGKKLKMAFKQVCWYCTENRRPSRILKLCDIIIIKCHTMLIAFSQDIERLWILDRKFVALTDFIIGGNFIFWQFMFQEWYVIFTWLFTFSSADLFLSFFLYKHSVVKNRIGNIIFNASIFILHNLRNSFRAKNSRAHYS